MRNFKLNIILILISMFLHAEDKKQLKMAVLPTTDLTSWGLAEALQYSLGKLALETRMFNVGSSNYVLKGFTRRDLKQAFESNRAPLMLFAYIENTRLSVFLFNAYYFGKFIASNKSLENSPTGKVSSQFIETQFKSAFEETMALYQKNQYQDLPRTEGDDEIDMVDQSVTSQLKQTKSEQMKDLFKEISQLEDKPFYFGANVGIARYTNAGYANSNVNLGLSVGGRLGTRISVAAGADFFSYILAHGDGFYKLPLSEKFISLSIIGSVGSVMANLTENKGYAGENASLKPGGFLFGPGLAIDIPLLGATIRGEFKYYLGTSSVLINTYGLIISI